MKSKLNRILLRVFACVTVYFTVTMFSSTSIVIAGCAVDKSTGSVYCGKGDCAVDGSTGTVYCANTYGGGAAADLSTGSVYCGIGQCAADLSTGTVYCANTPGSGAAADLSTGSVYCADQAGIGASMSNCTQGSMSKCEIGDRY